MAEKRRHHYIPQFYLRGFVDPQTPAGQTPYLWVRDTVSGSVSCGYASGTPNPY